MAQRWCSGLMIRLSTQRFHVQIPLRMDYFEIFNTILKNKNSKAPGDMVQGPKGAWLSVVGSLTGCSALLQKVAGSSPTSAR